MVAASHPVQILILNLVLPEPGQLYIKIQYGRDPHNTAYVLRELRVLPWTARIRLADLRMY